VVGLDEMLSASIRMTSTVWFRNGGSAGSCSEIRHAKAAELTAHDGDFALIPQSP